VLEVAPASLIPLLVYASLAMQCVGYLSRDELHWRPAMLFGNCLNIVYYSIVAAHPLRDAIITNAALASVNLGMILLVIHERSTWSMSAETSAVYRLFPMLSPGQFRQLLRIGRRETAGETRVLVSEGAVPETLYFVLSGPVTIEKGGRSTRAGSGIFIAEVAFLTDRPASATVRVGPGAEYLVWEVPALRRVLARRKALRAAMVASLNLDLARKVARSQPVTPSSA